jgi:large subunit ribosomal protein L30
MMETKKLFVIRVRGRVRLLTTVKDTLDMMRLYNTNYCILVPATPVMLGMIAKAKDYITWGEADDAVVQEIFEKRGTLYTGPKTDSKKKITYDNRYVEYNGKKYQKFFALNPPRRGYGRKGIKTLFVHQGALGNRGAKINDLVRRML